MEKVKFILVIIFTSLVSFGVNAQKRVIYDDLYGYTARKPVQKREKYTPVYENTKLIDSMKNTKDGVFAMDYYPGMLQELLNETPQVQPKQKSEAKYSDEENELTRIVYVPVWAETYAMNHVYGSYIPSYFRWKDWFYGPYYYPFAGIYHGYRSWYTYWDPWFDPFYFGFGFSYYPYNPHYWGYNPYYPPYYPNWRPNRPSYNPDKYVVNNYRRSGSNSGTTYSRQIYNKQVSKTVNSYERRIYNNSNGYNSVRGGNTYNYDTFNDRNSNRNNNTVNTNNNRQYTNTVRPNNSNRSSTISNSSGSVRSSGTTRINTNTSIRRR